MVDFIPQFINYLLIIKYVAIYLIKIVLLLIAIAYYTLAERKIMAAVQRRTGPNVVGLFGLLQPLADGLKLLTKELIVPSSANSRIFLFAPLLILILSLMSWIVISFGVNNYQKYNLHDISNVENNYIASFISSLMHYINLTELIPFSAVANLNYTILFILAISSLNVYGIIIAGWASNSKYAFLGALRSSAQMISYEVAIGLIILPVIFLASSLNFTRIVFAQTITVWYIFPLLPCAIIFFISMLAETNRTPFDLTEAEAELVAGYNTEYSSIIFAMFFLAEYSNMLLMSSLFVILFLGGWSNVFFLWAMPDFLIFSLKTTFICFLFVLVRATFPRYRYDQLMNIGWKIFLPISLGYLFLITSILLTFNCIALSIDLAF